MDWMVRIPDLPGEIGAFKQEIPAPQIFPRADQDIRPCLNTPRGCRKHTVYNKLVYHQVICSYPPYTSAINTNNVRRHKLKGHLALALGEPEAWVSFNNSLMREPHLQAQFLFLESKGRLHIQAVSRAMPSASYKLTFSFATGKCTMKGCFDGSVQTTLLDKNTKIVSYKLIVTYEDMPILIN